MKLWNADGSPAELSGNGLRCLAALVARTQCLSTGSSITVDTDAGVKTLELLARDGERLTFRAAMGLPEDLRQVSITAAGESVSASVLRLGNPQCIVLGPLPDADRFTRLGSALATHAMFPAGTNVEFAQVEAPDRVRILIWERGVGPTTSSGTGTSASAVAAAAHGGAARELDVVAPGGTQRVEWREDSVYLTGWAELILEGEWLSDRPLRLPEGLRHATPDTTTTRTLRPRTLDSDIARRVRLSRTCLSTPCGVRGAIVMLMATSAAFTRSLTPSSDSLAAR